jgi:hypothetical protein
MAISDEKNNDGMIWVSSLVSRTTREGVLEFTWGENRAQLSCQEAREHALGILECAEAAESDSFLVHFLMQELGLEFEKAVQIMASFRTYREQRLKEKRQ